jgi:hypothetical protein
MPRFIDPEELPFTTDEVYRAARLWDTDDEARHLAASLMKAGPGVVKIRAERREYWHRHGLQDAARRPLFAWAYPHWLLPALAVLSPELENRITSLRAWFLEFAGHPESSEEWQRLVDDSKRRLKQSNGQAG